MLNPVWGRYLRQLFPAHGSPRGKPFRRILTVRMRLEELESRLAPASFAVDAQLQISRLDGQGDTPSGTRAVVFFESTLGTSRFCGRAWARERTQWCLTAAAMAC